MTEKGNQRILVMLETPRYYKIFYIKGPHKDFLSLEFGVTSNVSLVQVK